MKASTVRAFTLIELIIAMGIVATVLGLSAAGLAVIRQTTQYQQAENDFVSALQTVQNMARNGVASEALMAQGLTLPQAQVDGYALFFTGNNYSIYYCLLTGSRYNCGLEQRDIKPTQFAEVSVAPTGATASKCVGILFTRLTTDIAGLRTQTSAQADNAGSCQITVAHTANAGLTRAITVDLANNVIDIAFR